MNSDFKVPSGYTLHEFAEIDSTNSEARRLADTANADKQWIVAERQSQGRGRRGREWVSNPGNLFTSLLLRPGKPLDELATLSFVAAITARQAILDLHPRAADRIKLKWPNDLLLDGKKIAGILLESGISGNDNIPFLVVGWGINCLDFPTDAPFQTTSLARNGFAVRASDLFTRLAIRFEEFYRVWLQKDGFAEIRKIWLQHAAGIGEAIIVRFAAREKKGVFEALDERGQLILRESDNSKTLVTAGDIFFSGPGNQSLKDIDPG